MLIECVMGDHLNMIQEASFFEFLQRSPYLFKTLWSEPFPTTEEFLRTPPTFRRLWAELFATLGALSFV